jgi:hypothetical protein
MSDTIRTTLNQQEVFILQRAGISLEDIEKTKAALQFSSGRFQIAGHDPKRKVTTCVVLFEVPEGTFKFQEKLAKPRLIMAPDGNPLPQEVAVSIVLPPSVRIVVDRTELTQQTLDRMEAMFNQQFEASLAGEASPEGDAPGSSEGSSEG